MKAYPEELTWRDEDKLLAAASRRTLRGRKRGNSYKDCVLENPTVGWNRSRIYLPYLAEYLDSLVTNLNHTT